MAKDTLMKIHCLKLIQIKIHIDICILLLTKWNLINLFIAYLYNNGFAVIPAERDIEETSLRVIAIKWEGCSRTIINFNPPEGTFKLKQ